MKKMWVFAAIVCAALMVACGGEKKSEKSGDLEAISSKDLVGTWKMVAEGEEISLITTLNKCGTGEVTVIENGHDHDGTFEITKWFYDSDKTLTIFVALDPERGEPTIQSYKITEISAGGDKMKAIIGNDRETINVTMTRVK